MKTYKIQIIEQVAQVFLVDAPDEESALEAAELAYKSGEFVLEPGELIDTDYECLGEDTEA